MAIAIAEIEQGSEDDGVPGHYLWHEANRTHKTGLVEDDAQYHCWNGAEKNKYRQPSPRVFPAAQKINGTRQKANAITPEINDDGEKRTHVDHDIGKNSLVGPAR